MASAKSTQGSTVGGIAGFVMSPTGKIMLITVGGAIVITVAYFGIIKPVFEFVGIKDSRQDKENKKTIELGESQNYWSPTFWKSNPQGLTYPEARYVSFAREIYDSISWYNTDEEAIYGVFKQLKTQADVSKLADVYQLINKQDLYQLLSDDFNTGEMATLQRILNNFIK